MCKREFACTIRSFNSLNFSYYVNKIQIKQLASENSPNEHEKNAAGKLSLW
ncbi:MAG: hypothetical protein ACI9KN_001708 [Gammaproteobacteria bacterium]|jgi:hypothetical protein